jgi:excinuclease ABC subunit C
MNKTLKERANTLPAVPGVYIFKDAKEQIIYVGKAKNLRSRVGSYFQNTMEPGTKTAALINRINDVTYIEALSELEALILEAELIKKHRPKYNISQKDDKSYLYILIRNEKVDYAGKKLLLPRVLTARQSDIKEKDKFFGPYPDGTTAKYIIRAVRKFLPYRDCSSTKFSRYHNLKRPCLYGHMGLCSAPCTGAVSINDYKKQVKRVERFLSGGSARIIGSLIKEMNKAVKAERFEEAAELRDVVKKIEYVSQGFKAPGKYLENPYLVEDLITRSLDDLVKNIPALKGVPKRIECYDISNISGKEAAGSMVVATNGRLDKSEYRKFKIKFKEKPDDFTMIREVVSRRLKNDWAHPDLMIIDGGKGQVTAALKAVEDGGHFIPVIGLAKRFETVVYYSGDRFEEVNLPKTNEGLKLLQRLRNEAHRFARRYHHQLRLKKISS